MYPTLNWPLQLKLVGRNTAKKEAELSVGLPPDQGALRDPKRYARITGRVSVSPSSMTWASFGENPGPSVVHFLPGAGRILIWHDQPQHGHSLWYTPYIIGVLGKAWAVF